MVFVSGLDELLRKPDSGLLDCDQIRPRRNRSMPHDAIRVAREDTEDVPTLRPEYPNARRWNRHFSINESHCHACARIQLDFKCVFILPCLKIDFYISLDTKLIVLGSYEDPSH